MAAGLTVEADVHFGRRGKGARRVLRSGPEPAQDRPWGRVPRISRLMALAIRFERLIHEGVVQDYADLARLGQVSRARITQIMNLLLLAPDIQETLLFLPRIIEGKEQICLRQLQAIAGMADWGKQRRAWNSALNKLRDEFC